jgi:hypothetical protein
VVKNNGQDETEYAHQHNILHTQMKFYISFQSFVAIPVHIYHPFLQVSYDGMLSGINAIELHMNEVINTYEL